MRRGEWSPLLIGIIVALILLSILLVLLFKGGGSASGFVRDLFGLQKTLSP